MRSIESLKDLNKKCQKPNYKTVGNWMVRNILRDAALPITWLLLHTSITANHVTIISMVIALTGGYLLTLASPLMFFLGVLCFQLWYLLDHVDGQIARYHNTASLEGRFFDFVMHHFVTFLAPFCTALGGYRIYEDIELVIIGFIASMSLVLIGLLNDARSKTVHEYLLLQKGSFDIVHESIDVQSSRRKTSIPRRLFSYLYKFCEPHVVLNVWTVVGVCALCFTGLSNKLSLSVFANLVMVLPALYAVVATLVWVAKLAYVIQSKDITNKTNTSFKKR